MLRPTVIEGRRQGNTTRLIDYYIQKLFDEGTTGIIVDHPSGDQQVRHRLDKILLDRIHYRLIGEHPDLINKCKIKVDTTYRIITLLQ